MLAGVAIDIILVAIILIGAIIGLKSGFVKIISKPVRFFGSLAIAFTFSDEFSAAFVEPRIYNPVSAKIAEYLYSHCGHLTAENAADELPTLLKLAAGIFSVDLNNFTGDSLEKLIASVVEKLATPVVHVISIVLSFFILFFISKIVLKILIAIVNSIFKTGVLSIPNRILGCVFYTLFSFIVAWLFATVFDFAIHAQILADIEWLNGFEGGYIYKVFRKLTPIDLLLSF